ncbi:MAG: glutamate cyclase domain-containing protein [Cellulophaga sp.]
MTAKEISLEKDSQKLEAIIAYDPGKRGISHVATNVQGGLSNAVLDISQTKKPAVAILTGFYIPYCEYPAAETDGPIGSAFLYNSLQKINIPTVIITDALCERVVKKACTAINHENQINIIVAENLSNDWEPDLWGKIEKLAGCKITHLVSIERPGKSHNDNYYDMKGKVLNDYIEPLDMLLPFCLKKKIVTIGIGDGGNEAGMGKIDTGIISQFIPNGKTIQSIVTCDFVIPCGVSNWGGFAIAALILHKIGGFSKNEIKKVINEELHHTVLDHIVNQSKAIDGVTKKSELKVDGLEESVHSNVIDKILNVFI